MSEIPKNFVNERNNYSYTFSFLVIATNNTMRRFEKTSKALKLILTRIWTNSCWMLLLIPRWGEMGSTLTKPTRPGGAKNSYFGNSCAVCQDWLKRKRSTSRCSLLHSRWLYKSQSNERGWWKIPSLEKLSAPLFAVGLYCNHFERIHREFHALYVEVVNPISFTLQNENVLSFGAR